MSTVNSFRLLYCTTYFSGHWVRNLVGDVPVLFHTLPYTPIFEPLKALYQFQEKLITTNPFTHANLTIVLDISEWVEHNDEPYFDVIMEYFMDHKHWRLMYVVHDKDHRLELIVKRCFLQLQLRFIRHGELFLEPVLDASEIRNHLVQHHRMTENEASILTEIMIQSSFDRYRTIEYIDRVIEDMSEKVGTSLVNGTMQKYALRSDSMLAAIDRKVIQSVLERTKNIVR